MCDYTGAGLGQLTIGGLKVGDVIEIAAGNGVPAVEVNTIDTVASTDGGFSVVTTSGVTLYARHGYGVKVVNEDQPAP